MKLLVELVLCDGKGDDDSEVRTASISIANIITIAFGGRLVFALFANTGFSPFSSLLVLVFQSTTARSVVPFPSHIMQLFDLILL